MVIKLNGVKHDLASCYHELKTKHYIRIVSEWDNDKPLKDRDYFKLFCILTDTEFKEFKKDNEALIWKCVKWVLEEPYTFPTEVPKVIELDTKIIDIPKRPEYLSAAQNIVCRQMMEKLPYTICDKCNKDNKEGCKKCYGVGSLPVFEAGISMAVAIYLQPLVDGDVFDYDKAMALKEKIDEMPAYLIYPVGFFLLKNVIESGGRYMNNLSRTRSSLGTIFKGIVQSLPKWRGWQALPT
jgi:hypothetical protein